MAYVAITKIGCELIFEEMPIRITTGQWVPEELTDMILLPSGSIKKLIGRELTWEDEPVELK